MEEAVIEGRATLRSRESAPRRAHASTQILAASETAARSESRLLTTSQTSTNPHSADANRTAPDGAWSMTVPLAPPAVGSSCCRNLAEL